MARVHSVKAKFDKVLSWHWTSERGTGDADPWSSKKPRMWGDTISYEGEFQCFVVGCMAFLPTADDCRRFLVGTNLRFVDGGSDRTLFESPLDILHAVSQRDVSKEMVKKFLENDDEWAGLATMAEVAGMLEQDHPFGSGVVGWYRLSTPFVISPAGTLVTYVSVDDSVMTMLNQDPMDFWASLRFFALGKRIVSAQ